MEERIKARIAALQAERERLALVIAQITAALGELQALLTPEEER